MTYASGSFRDPAARVLAGGGPTVLRALTQDAAAVDAALRARGLLDELVRDGLLVESAPRLDVTPPAGYAAVVESRRLPFVSYPYEWSFSMLQDAALLTLDLTERALAADVLLKDASAYNVLFDGARPLFIDIASLAGYEPGQPWVAYGQFVDHFLAPLMLEAYKGVPFQPLLRSNLEGLPVGGTLSRLLGGRDLLRPGVLTHVRLRAMLDRNTQDLGTGMRRAVRQATLPKSAVVRNVQGLRQLTARLRSTAPSAWRDYENHTTYDAEQAAAKEAFVGSAAERAGRDAMAWDVGANTGRYSRVLARHVGCVVAMDGDAGAIDRLYRDLRDTGDGAAIIPLVMDVMNPSPAQGWCGVERQALLERARPALAVYLALMHHVCLGRGVPLPAFVDFVRATSDVAVLEFVAVEDPMSQTVLATKVERHPGYDLASLRARLQDGGTILAEQRLSPTRTLILVEF